MREADRVNNFGVIGIFLVTLINVFLSTFSGSPGSKAGTGSEDNDIGSGDGGSGIAADESIIHT